MRRRHLILFAAGAVLVLGAESFWLWKTYVRLRDVEVAKRRAVIAEEVLAASTHITSATISDPSSTESKNVFAETYHALQSPRLIRFKVWTPDKTVVWSNLQEIIGQKFADNEEVEETVDGAHPVMSIEDPTDSETEHVSERNFEALTETYVPLIADGHVFGVVEVYEPAEAVLSPARSALRNGYALPTAAVTLAGFSAAWFFLARVKKEKSSAEKTRRA